MSVLALSINNDSVGSMDFQSKKNEAFFHPYYDRVERQDFARCTSRSSLNSHDSGRSGRSGRSGGGGKLRSSFSSSRRKNTSSATLPLLPASLTLHRNYSTTFGGKKKLSSSKLAGSNFNELLLNRNSNSRPLRASCQSTPVLQGLRAPVRSSNKISSKNEEWGVSTKNEEWGEATNAVVAPKKNLLIGSFKSSTRNEEWGNNLSRPVTQETNAGVAPKKNLDFTRCTSRSSLSSHDSGGGGKLRSLFSGSRRKIASSATPPLLPASLTLRRNFSTSFGGKKKLSSNSITAGSNFNELLLNRNSSSQAFTSMRASCQSTPVLQGLRAAPVRSSNKSFSKNEEWGASATTKNEEWGEATNAVAAPKKNLLIGSFKSSAKNEEWGSVLSRPLSQETNAGVAPKKNLFTGGSFIGVAPKKNPLTGSSFIGVAPKKNPLAELLLQNKNSIPSRPLAQATNVDMAPKKKPLAGSFTVMAPKKNPLTELIEGAAGTVHKNICSGSPPAPPTISHISPTPEELTKSDDISISETTIADDSSSIRLDDISESNIDTPMPEEIKEDIATAENKSKWREYHLRTTLMDSCPLWLSSFLPKAASSLSKTLKTLAPPEPQAAVEPIRMDTQKNLRFSTMEDHIKYEITPDDIKNSWNVLNVPTTLKNIALISQHRGIAVSYSDSSYIPGKTCMVHIEPAPLIGEILRMSDRHRQAVFAEQARQRVEGDLDVEKLGEVARTYSRWGVELTLSSWWLER